MKKSVKILRIKKKQNTHVIISQLLQFVVEGEGSSI